MLIALDWDGTYTAAPEFWRAFVYMAKAAGHEVIIATMRHESEPVSNPPCMVYYTGRRAKQQTLTTMGVHPDVWVDDCPHFIFTNAADL